jgi:hypothetical protein
VTFPDQIKEKVENDEGGLEIISRNLTGGKTIQEYQVSYFKG